MKFILPLFKSENGQTVLVILLVMSVILTIGLSAASRSVTDIKISQQSQEAARAFWAAQAGLEEAMKGNVSIGKSEEKEVGGVKYWVDKKGMVGAEGFVFPDKVNAEESVTLWLLPHNETTGEINFLAGGYNGNINLYWGDPESSTISDQTPAIEATLVYGEGSLYKMQKFTFDPNTGRNPLSHFEAANSGEFTLNGQTFSFSSGEINLSDYSNPYLLQLRLHYNVRPQILGVKAAGLPEQGYCYDSSGEVAESGITRRLNQCRLWQILPQVFDNVVFSGENI